MIDIGQKIFLKPTGNAARRSKDIIETEVTKVGRKFFEVKDGWYGRFFIDGMYQDAGQYISDYQAYFSMEEIENERLAHKLHDEIRANYFNTFSSVLPLETLKKIKELIKDKEK